MLLPYTDQTEVPNHRDKLPWLEALQQFVAPSLSAELSSAGRIHSRWLEAREQILTEILRVATALSLIAFMVSLSPVLALGLWPLAILYSVCLSIVGLLSFYRQISYRLRAGSFLFVVYVLAASEIVSFGYTEDVYGYLTVFALLSLILLGRGVGIGALLAGTITLAFFGLGQSLGTISPLVFPVRQLTPEMAITTSTLFLTCIGISQAAVSGLLNRIDAAWQESQRAREMLEQRVTDRTRELVEARDEALALSQYRSEQNQFLSALHQTALDLLQRQDREQILQEIVGYASLFLEAPFAQLLLADDDQLVVHAYTANLPLVEGDRVDRANARLAWQAIDQQRPLTVDDYAAWSGRRLFYEGLSLKAVVNIPIMIGQRCLGVLALARTTAGHPFTTEEIQKGQLFSQLAAVVLDNVNLYTTALTEIAERRAVEEALRSQNAELDAFAHTVAHDLKGPLTYQIGTIELFQLMGGAQSPADMQEQFGEMLVASRKMNAIIESLLMLSSVRSRRRVQIASLEMHAIVAESIHRLKSQIDAASAMIIQPDSWPIAYGYAPWVEEIWVNYLSNALKYGGKPPQIAVGADLLDGGLVRFWVQDNGHGLTIEEQAQLFTPFTQLQTANLQGHGLGLSIVQRIATQLGGTVGVESDVGGSRFFFTLPAYNPQNSRIHTDGKPNE